MLRARLVLPLLAVTVLLGCSQGKRVPAVGPGYEIIVFSAGATRSHGNLVARILAEEVQLVRHEPRFETVDEVLSEFNFYKTRKLLFIVGEKGDEEVRKIRKKATGTRIQTDFPGLTVEVEPFAAGQVLFTLLGEPDEIQQSLLRSPDDLVAVVEDTAVTLLLTNIFRAGEMPGARRQMRARWGWGVRVAPEWVVDDRFQDQRFVRVWRDAPVEQLFVSWEPGRVERTPEEWLARRGELVRDFYEGDENVADRSIAEEGPTPYGRNGVHLQGLWENDKYVIGGPFESWAFHCPQDDRTYLVDISVYAPDRPKRPLMRTLEAVARTFRCGCVPPPSRGQPS